MDYYRCYNNARNRYYNACSEINRCENRINELRNQRTQKINQINQLKTDIRNHEQALDGVTQIIRREESVNAKILDVNNKTSQAATNYIGMVTSSDAPSKNLSDVYNNETTTTRRTVNSIFENLKSRKSNLETKIADLKSRLRAAESDLQDIENRIRSTESDLQSWRRNKTNASIDMEYYRRRMNEAG